MLIVLQVRLSITFTSTEIILLYALFEITLISTLLLHDGVAKQNNFFSVYFLIF
jgi:hypothetical protein